MKNILLLALLLCALNSHGQSAQEKKLLQKLSDTACTCLREGLKDVDSNALVYANFTAVAVPCLTEQALLCTKLLKLRGLALTHDNLEKLGVEIGAKLASDKCDIYVKYLNNMARQSVQEYSSNEETGDTEVSGTVSAASCDNFCSIKLKQSDGKIITLHYVINTENAEDLIADMKALINVTLSTSYRAMEIYDASAKKFVTLNVITGYTLVE